jgi:SET domain-containing protein
MYCFASDDARYFNHSDDPNSLSAYYEGEDECVTKAIRDIKPGEEITDNYQVY